MKTPDFLDGMRASEIEERLVLKDPRVEIKIVNGTDAEGADPGNDQTEIEREGEEAEVETRKGRVSELMR